MSDTTEPTLEDLRTQARELELEGRSKMDRDELEAAVRAELERRDALVRAELEAAAGTTPGEVPDANADEIVAADDDQAGDSELPELTPLAEVARARYEARMARTTVIDFDAPEGS